MNHQVPSNLNSSKGCSRGPATPLLTLLLASTLAITLTACGKAGQTNASVSSEIAASTAASDATSSDAGSSMLSTDGDTAKLPSTIKAAQGTFTVTDEGGGQKHLLVNGRPWLYNQDVGGDALIEANNDLTLMGVIELPHESVAWVVINGGNACPATHILVSIEDGKPYNGHEIPGCDDRGTLRRVGHHIEFEAGGSTGSYSDNKLSVEKRADQGGAQ